MILESNALENALRSLQRRVDQLERNAPSGSRIDYGANHTMSGTPHGPVGAASGWYVRINDLFIWEFISYVGAGVGTGTMRLTPPFDIKAVGIYGVWRLSRAGNPMATGPITLASGNAAIEFVYPVTWPSGAQTSVTATTPFALNTGDNISGFVVAGVDYGRVPP